MNVSDRLTRIGNGMRTGAAGRQKEAEGAVEELRDGLMKFLTKANKSYLALLNLAGEMNSEDLNSQLDQTGRDLLGAVERAERTVNKQLHTIQGIAESWKKLL